ncbi:hypothetical protein SCP_0802590 [Sparassis crispa]|uniref:Uncharacterized protein n=1 Tax=Sparassis crispa TaxID=139825 RepID=A0A401GU46_9APHY|nr:hypothetical protein SCP_0802590 [Sparassis crispa]GBE85737.1 hypothetical protein SCP_0802590 [Sparassis crispa]
MKPPCQTRGLRSSSLLLDGMRHPPPPLGLPPALLRPLLSDAQDAQHEDVPEHLNEAPASNAGAPFVLVVARRVTPTTSSWPSPGSPPPSALEQTMRPARRHARTSE